MAVVTTEQLRNSITCVPDPLKMLALANPSASC